MHLPPTIKDSLTLDPAFRQSSAKMTDAKMLLPINPLSEWDSFVGDETQCMSLSPAEEIQFLSSKSPSSKIARKGFLPYQR